MEKLYSIEDAAQALGGVSKWAVESWLSQGRLQRTKVGSRTMIRESELKRFLDACANSKTRSPRDRVAV